MKSHVATDSLAKFLMAKGLIPQGCQNVEVLIGVHTVMKVRYEVMLDAEVLAQWGQSFSETATAKAEDDERNRKALQGEA